MNNVTLLLVTLLFLRPTAYGQKPVDIKHVSKWSMSLSVGNVISGSVRYKNIDVQLVKHPTNYLNGKPFSIDNVNYHYKYLFVGIGTQGLSFGAQLQIKQYQLTAGMAGKYGYVIFGVASMNRLILPDNKFIICGLQFISGVANAIRSQVIFHPNELFTQHPNLNRAWWDSRETWSNGSGWNNANHVFQTIQVGSQIAAAVFVINGEKKNWKKYVLDGLLYTGAYKAGWYVMWYGHFGNKL